MQGYVYLIGSSLFGWYKIGKSITPEIRLNSLGVLLPFKIEVFAVWKSSEPLKLEAHLHRKYHLFRINGEWFKLPKSTVELLQNNETLLPNRVYSFMAFKTVKHDCPEGYRMTIKVKKAYPQEYQEHRKLHSILYKKLKRINKRVTNLSPLGVSHLYQRES